MNCSVNVHSETEKVLKWVYLFQSCHIAVFRNLRHSVKHLVLHVYKENPHLQNKNGQHYRLVMWPCDNVVLISLYMLHFRHRNKKFLGSDLLGPGAFLCACSSHVHTGSHWVLWLPPGSKTCIGGRVDDSELTFGESMSVDGCQFLYFCPAMSWQLVRGIARLSPRGRWERLQLPERPHSGIKQ